MANIKPEESFVDEKVFLQKKNRFFSVRFRTDTPTLMRAFNHSSEAQTLAYLGVEARDVHAAFMNQI